MQAGTVATGYNRGHREGPFLSTLHALVFPCLNSDVVLLLRVYKPKFRWIYSRASSKLPPRDVERRALQ